MGFLMCYFLFVLMTEMCLCVGVEVRCGVTDGMRVTVKSIFFLLFLGMLMYLLIAPCLFLYHLSTDFAFQGVVNKQMKKLTLDQFNLIVFTF